MSSRLFWMLARGEPPWHVSRDTLVVGRAADSKAPSPDLAALHARLPTRFRFELGAVDPA